MNTATAKTYFGKMAQSALPLGLLILGLNARAAETSGPNAGDKVKELTGAALAADRAHLASELATYGREAKSAMALVVAAGIQTEAAGREVDRQKSTEGAGAKSEKMKVAVPSRSTVSGMLTDARALARGDKGVLATIGQLESREGKGRVCDGSSSCATYHTDRVKAGFTDTYTLRFRGGEPAVVTVIGDGDTDLDLNVYDQNGNMVCSDTDYTDRTVCRWQPVWTGQFTIKIQNLGDVWNGYTLRTN